MRREQRPKSLNFFLESGLHEAIGKSRNVLGSLDLLSEIDLLSSFFTRVATGGFVAFGAKQIGEAIAGDAVETLILTERAADYLVCKKDGSVFVCKPTDARVLEAESAVPLVECRNRFEVRVVSANSKEGAQFEGFEIAAMLRYAMFDQDEEDVDSDKDETDEEFL